MLGLFLGIAIFILGCLMIIPLVLMFKVNKNMTEVNDSFKGFVEYTNKLDYLIDTADKEVVNVEVIDKKIEEKLNIDNDITYVPSGSMMLPVNNTNTSTSYKFVITVKSVDGMEKILKVTSSEYDSLSIGDKTNITIYRNNGIFELEPSSKDNIVSIRLGDTTK